MPREAPVMTMSLMVSEGSGLASYLESFSTCRGARASAVGCGVRKDGKERRDEILDAALACFTREGILHTGIDQIRRRAGASASSVYHQFDDLGGIVLALLERTFERLFAQLAARVTKTRTARRA
jgi:AcrR family transcriptional regulator